MPAPANTGTMHKAARLLPPSANRHKQWNPQNVPAQPAHRSSAPTALQYSPDQKHQFPSIDLRVHRIHINATLLPRDATGTSVLEPVKKFQEAQRDSVP